MASFDGTCRLTMSEELTSSSSDSHQVTPISSARATTCALRPDLATAWTWIPKAAARSATPSPIEPSPTMPMVEPSSPPALL